jgi:hypothetical protein
MGDEGIRNGASGSVANRADRWAEHPRGLGYGRGKNFLKCKGGAFALCYYSGPEGLLPCDAKPNDTVAKCQCLEIAYGVYFVDINAILDVDTHEQTVQYCGKSGSDCTAVNAAPVCSIINANKPFPGADVISVFSFACAQEQGRGNTPCDDPALYAGCMTALCYRKSGSAAGTVECLCPTFKGPFQVGKDDQSRDLGKRNVWSASYTVPGGNGGFEAGGTSTAPKSGGVYEPARRVRIRKTPPRSGGRPRPRSPWDSGSARGPEPPAH